MGIEFTKEQRQVIELRDRNILVSAAAGSGKTAVLVERIITRLTKDQTPLNVDELLIMTFTEAAASEMKERIHHAIEKALEENPDNLHLRQQATLIHQAQITTMHKFCLSVIRDYFHTIDLDPGFRVGEEGELKLLKHDVAEHILETAYEEQNQAFLRFVECYASGKDDRNLEELVLQLYEISRSYPNPNKWLEACAEQYDVRSVEELINKPFVKQIVEEVHQYAEDMTKLLEYAMTVCDEEDGPSEYQGTLHSDWLFVKELQSKNNFQEMQQWIQGVQWAILKPCRDKSVSVQKIELIKNIRKEVKELIHSLEKQYFFDDVQVMQMELMQTKENVKTLICLTQAFADAFSEEKKNKNLIDFNDMEQYALQILTREEDDEIVPTAVAKIYQEKFAEVMIDEYQDSNFVQEAILTSVSRVSRGIYNIFMVGDVKQSIYRFRLSRPELFMEKFNSYGLLPCEKQRIDLHKNFRSRREVLETANFVFEQVMISEFGGITYDHTAALNVGAAYEPRNGNETEIILVDAEGYKAEQQMEMEAEVVATRIKELVGHHEILDKKTESYRKVQYKDIVILMRSLQGTVETYASVLEEYGIPTYTNSKQGYFQTSEIKLILQYLTILDNPRQDIPLAAVLSSVLGGFNSEELAKIRVHGKAKTLYESVLMYIEDGKENVIRERLRAFTGQFHAFREQVPYTAIHALLWQILTETGYMDYVAALPAGQKRQANLEMLVEKAVTYGKSSYKGLFNFVRYMEQLQKYNVDYGEANLSDEKMDVVNMMSIHKSKGLEFPIVFVVGMGKGFNTRDSKQSVVVHPDLGIGLDAIDEVRRVKATTLLKSAIKKKVTLESKAEELRVLYVAMTRAKEKLILTGASANIEADLAKLPAVMSREEKELSYYYLTKANRYMDWVLPALARHHSLQPLLNEYELPIPFTHPLFARDVPIQVRKVGFGDLVSSQMGQMMEDELTKEVLSQWDVTRIYDEKMRNQLNEQFSYRYPYESGQGVKQKLSVSELKKKAYATEEGEPLFHEEEIIPLLPKFLRQEKTLSGASRGSAYHKLMEVLDVSQEYDEESLGQEIRKKIQDGILTEEMGDAICKKSILRFLSSSVGRRMQSASKKKKCFAEQPFVLGVEAEKIYPDMESGEWLLIQGIVDVYFEEDDELVLLDYKTDNVSCEQLLIDRYHAQLEHYAKALERLTGKKVKEKIIYSFTLNREIFLSE